MAMNGEPLTKYIESFFRHLVWAVENGRGETAHLIGFNAKGVTATGPETTGWLPYLHLPK